VTSSLTSSASITVGTSQSFYSWRKSSLDHLLKLKKRIGTARARVNVDDKKARLGAVDTDVVVRVVFPPPLNNRRVGGGLGIPLINYWMLSDLFWFPVSAVTRASSVNNSVTGEDVPPNAGVVISPYR
jgi:hypothetical protein